jgi:hypothetical protein
MTRLIAGSSHPPLPQPQQGRIASSRMLLKDSAPMTGAASPNQVGGANGERDQHGRTARGVGGGG